LFWSQLPPKRFGLVSVYDGDAVGLGRVVCDSTWHHWLSFNLAGIAEANNADYRKMQAYYRNIALWLARPAQRGAMSLAAVWKVLTLSGPMAFSGRRTPWEMGERALALLGGWLAPCWTNELVVSQLNASCCISRIGLVAGFIDSSMWPSEDLQPRDSWRDVPCAETVGRRGPPRADAA
jgi:hypothetical protein